MNDKERILMAIISRIIPGLSLQTAETSKYVEYSVLNPHYEKGDLVVGMTSIQIHEFLVGFVERVEENCVVIREIGSNKLCNYYNENFLKINKERLGYEILEGVQYKIYTKVLKAFRNYSTYGTRFNSLRFDGNVCIVAARKMFSNDVYFEFQFTYNSKTTIKYIGEILEKAEKQAEKTNAKRKDK